jgi:hypothetical protein
MARLQFTISDKFKSPRQSGTPTIPFVGRFPMPPNGEAAKTIARFILQVFILSTIAVKFAAWVRELWPAGALLMFGVGGASLLLLSGIKWLWGSRVGGFPSLTVIVFVGGALSILDYTAGPAGPSLSTLFILIVGAYLLMFFVSIARMADAATMWQDWHATLFLSVGAFLLLFVTQIPQTEAAFTLVFCTVLCANVILITIIALTYVEYILANPMHPQAVVEAARNRWIRILYLKEFFTKENLFSPVVFCVFACFGIIAFGVALLSLQGLHQYPAPTLCGYTPNRPTDLPPVEIIEFACFGLISAVVFLAVIDNLMFGKAVWGALSVWLLYGYRCESKPAIFQPTGWLASVRFRQSCVAILLFFNVVVPHLGYPPEIFLPQILRRLADHNISHTPERIMIFGYVMVTVAPLLIPFLMLPLIIRREVKSIFNEIEKADPVNLYPHSQGEKA